MTVVASKRQVTPFLVDVASSSERLSKLSVTGDRAKPVSSTLAHARTATIATADAAADARHEASVRRAYVTLGLKDVARIAALPFPASVNKTAGAQQQTRSVKTAMSEIFMRSDDRCTEGLKSPTWVPGWDLPLHKASMRSITTDKPSTADMTTLIDECFRQVSRDGEEGASGLEAFNLLLRRLMTRFDRVDTGEGYTQLQNSGVCTGTLFCIFSREFRVLVSAVTGSDRTLDPGVDAVLEVVRMAVNEQFPTLMPTLYPGSMARDPKPYASLDKMWKVFGDLANNKTPAVNVFVFVFLCLFLRRERGHPPRRGSAPPVMGAARAECRLRRLHGRRDRAIIRLSCL